MVKYLISACLVGDNCKYNGGNNLHHIAKKLYDDGLALPVCPEELGGLSTPRIPCEIVDDKVLNKVGIDKTNEFFIGASKTLKTAKEHGITKAILQSRSPSCGSNQIYDGSFSGSLIEGSGVTTKLLRKHGIKVITIEEYVASLDK